jgi:hypothetical protein
MAMAPLHANPFIDRSGDVEVRVWEKSTEVKCFGCTVEASVDPDYVLVGGGAAAEFSDRNGGLIISSYPASDSLGTWRAEACDNTVAAAYTLKVFAVGLKLKGVSRTELGGHVYLASNSSKPSETKASCDVTLPHDYQLIGGGARVLNVTPGRYHYLTDSYPRDERTWTAASHDHVTSAMGTITSYAIGIKNGVIPGFGRLEVGRLSYEHTAKPLEHHTVQAGVQTEYVQTCVGAQQENPLRLIYKMIPVHAADGKASVATKDHIHPEQGWTRVWSLEVRKKAE